MRREEELATIAVDICYKLHIELGPGLLESVYEEAFVYELLKRGIDFTRQQHIPVFYDNKQLGNGFRADLILEGRLLVEIKSIEKLEKVHHKIVLTYLRLSGIKLAILVNFNVNLVREGICRKINSQYI
jgi:GxxExxY protein